MKATRTLPTGLPEGARIRVARGLGVPRLLAIGLSAVGASIYFILGVVTRHALGLTPVVFVLASVFFVITTMTYLEGNSILSQPYFVILNLAVGGQFDGDPQSDAIFPATMLVDWVRVYVKQ